MGEEKIFKDLTKKYAELASKDKRSSSLIKGCSKRIALLDKLRVLEVSYLKCLKNKVKRGQKGGEGERKQQDDANQQDTLEIDIATNELDATDLTETTEPSVIDKHQRALAVCTKALVKTIDLKEKAKEFIEKNKEAILEAYENINIEQEKEILRNESTKLASATLKENTGMDAEAALATAYSKSIDLRDSVMTKLSPTVTTVKHYATQGLENAKKRFNGLWASSNQQQTQPDTTQPPTGGSKKTTYKLNGEKVVLLHKNKKVQRSIYVKGNGKTKYCKIDHQYILLSKLKNKIQ